VVSKLFHASPEGFFVLDFFGVDNSVKDGFFVVNGGEDVVF
jgi:hypothetical protein